MTVTFKGVGEVFREREARVDWDGTPEVVRVAEGREVKLLLPVTLGEAETVRERVTVLLEDRDPPPLPPPPPPSPPPPLALKEELEESVRVFVELGVKVEDTPVAEGEPEGVLEEVVVLVVVRDRVAVEDEVCVGVADTRIATSDTSPPKGSTGATAITNVPTLSASMLTESPGASVCDATQVLELKLAALGSIRYALTSAAQCPDPSARLPKVT